MATPPMYSLAWKFTGQNERGGPQSMGSQKNLCSNLATEQQQGFFVLTQERAQESHHLATQAYLQLLYGCFEAQNLRGSARAHTSPKGFLTVASVGCMDIGELFLPGIMSCLLSRWKRPLA